MATYWDQRCSLCGQYVPASDREAMLEATRWEWDEALVDEALVDRHVCIDRDPFGARESARLADAGLIAPELRWLIEAALKRKQAAGSPAWAVFTGPGAWSAIVPMVVGRMSCRWSAGGPLRPALGQVWDQLPADCGSRSPPSRGRILDVHHHAHARTRSMSPVPRFTVPKEKSWPPL